jgi:hypothetical protein
MKARARALTVSACVRYQDTRMHARTCTAHAHTALHVIDASPSFSCAHARLGPSVKMDVTSQCAYSLFRSLAGAVTRKC